MSYTKIHLKPHCEAGAVNPSPTVSLPLFQAQQVQGGRPDGYWIEAFPFSTDEHKCPNIIGYGLGTSTTKSEIKMFLNPYTTSNSDSSDWKSVTLAELDFPVTMHYADITGNGFNDVIISDQYGPSMDDIWPDGGRVNWLENTGDPNMSNWPMRTIGQSPGMHRLKAGHFTRKDRLQICAVPIVVKSSDLTTPAPVIIFTAPNDPKKVTSWPSEIIAKKHLVHEVVIAPSPANNGLDGILLAGRDGVDLLWFDTEWKEFKVGTGLPPTDGDPYWGAASVAVGRVGDDFAGYIASIEAFHGNTVSVYTKPAGSPHGIINSQWTRHVLDDFGPLNDKHTGSIHQVVCADIDGDGNDEFLTAMMGADPPDFNRTGVWCYKMTNQANGTFTKTKLDSTSAGRIATAHFLPTAIKTVDYATISYSVPGYFESPNPSINVFLSTGILPEKLDNEVSFRVVRASTAGFPSEMEFLDVAGRKLTLVVLPPLTSFKVQQNTSAVKILAGSLYWKEGQSGKKQERFVTTRPHGCQNLVVNASTVESGDEGSIFTLFKASSTSGKPPFSSMQQVIAHNAFPAHVPDDVRAMNFKWFKVEDLPWAHGRFDGLEFYNLVGFNVRFSDDSMDEVAHIQLWTAGIGVSAGFHNHIEKSFAEIHACITNGTGEGGMRWATVPDDQFDRDNPDLTKTKLVVVPDLHEHGPLWRIDKDGYPLLRMNDTVDYPWHAWLAGNGKPGQKQAYDVWVAFEFPSFETYSTPPPKSVLEPGTYVISPDGSSGSYYLGLKDEDATDRTPVLAFPGSDRCQTWKVSRVPGTDVYEIAHVKTGSLLCSRWPPVTEQRVVGTHSPANMGMTSRWTAYKDDDGKISLRLPGPHKLFLDTSKNLESPLPVVVRSYDSPQPPAWKFDRV
ncbi:Aldos-2-ulose dehydratase [Marasmius oreades]|uniref:Aldos-2-ulose dehydratase n=1 Tax=Marasmius oreades TaxID=181124 RepID=A0A9P8AE74_9AGAR|nr:Aldos-2-ulose dehydratase [Marasmius oreades]KAG7098218.1 Aldos-2-ulose dehydratase [Marasmius oreades]